MNKKTLQVDGIINELKGASLFFNPPIKIAPPIPSVPDQELEPSVVTPELVMETENHPPIPTAVKIDNAINGQMSNNASKLASKQSTKRNDLIKTIRKTVKQVGKEVLFVRLSPNEKHTLGSIVYAFNEMYRGEGYKTTENEIGRIGLNYLLEDYQENGSNSILAQVLAALIA